MNIHFNLETINKLFPLYIVVSHEGEIISSGDTMQKLMRIHPQEPSFDRYFTIHKPIQSSFSDLMKSQSNQMIVFKMKNPIVTLMGQVLQVPDQSLKLFAMNIVVQSPDELTGLQLDFNDFAIQDPIFDYLLLLQTERRATQKADIANKKLVDANQVAMKASNAKSQFLANMSHELRTPMNGVLGMASVLMDTNLDELQKECVHTILSSGDAMLSLVNDILDLSKIEAGYVNLEPTPFDLAPLIHEVCQTVLPLAQQKKIDLNYLIAEDVPVSIFQDRSRLRQVILNLVANAVKFTQVGFVKIEVSVQDARLLIHVRDSGIGMKLETVHQLFSPFVQGDSSMTKKFEGTGLGLAISKKIIESMRGMIRVESIFEEGSVFTIDLSLEEFDRKFNDNS